MGFHVTSFARVTADLKHHQARFLGASGVKQNKMFAYKDSSEMLGETINKGEGA